MEGREIDADRADLLPGDVLDHVAPVRADVAHRPERAAVLRLDAPVPVGVVEQPVLRVGALRDENLSELAGLAHRAHLLHHRVEAQVVAGGMAHLLRRGPGGQRGGVRARRRQRFLAHDVLARVDRLGRHGEMPRVGRADVDGVDRRIGEDRAVVGLARSTPKAAANSSALCETAPGDGGNVHDAQAAQRFAVHPAHEARPDDRRAQTMAGHDGRESITLRARVVGRPFSGPPVAEHHPGDVRSVCAPTGVRPRRGSPRRLRWPRRSPRPSRR